MEDVVIVSLARTPIGKFGGALKDISAIDLGAHVVREAVRRAGLEPGQVDRVVFGQNMQINRGGNPARRIHLAAGLPVEVDDYTVNMNCASGLRAVAMAVQDIRSGDAEVVVAGGTENMSRTPYLLEGARFGYRLGNATVVDFLADYILGDAGPMAENVAARYGISRERQDAWALTSHQRAVAAWEAGRFAEEVVPVPLPGGQVFARDEHMRPDTSMEKLSRLRPAFRPDGTVTAGNASGINDGAAAVVLMRASRAAALGCRPLAVVRGWASAGVEPDYFGMGPVPATQKLLGRLGMSLADIDLVELNEAFASSTLAVMDVLGLDPERTNVNGGAIALGHPVGATGVVLLIKVIQELRRRQGRYGLVTMCIGSGQGMSLLVQRAEEA